MTCGLFGRRPPAGRALSWAGPCEGSGWYFVAKAAEWEMANGVRAELAAQHTFAQGVHLGAAAPT
ncbi:short chain dehydrogenase [Streptomyces sp. ADI96-15]|uniref:oxidoreductase n=1 Tax=Streptomyces TaxID=1883 RepID=UPI0003C2FABE|nr:MULTISPECIES: oxidoreductase [Streptomyces]ESP97309.1 oxidoreductase [Streptomyces sp. GBA 94-10 4N24]ESQ03467.1 oxidoreductase [Streptomyces sp. PVA_94-07]RPK68277.1 short chain dehydrogenase [Streptomyces sp. ADI96-15]RWZ73202.1 hypothetical protein EQK42_25650 [Streptomyces albidoflavus]UZN61726.1 oxidoreductase [Streptomyces sp. GBA 94-10 4N24]